MAAGGYAALVTAVMLAGAMLLPGAPGALASASPGGGPARARSGGAAVPPGRVPVVLEPCLHGRQEITCWAVRPTNTGDATLSFNLEIGRGGDAVTAFVSGLSRWGAVAGGAIRTLCAPECPRLTVSFPPGVWTVLAGLRVTLSRPEAATYPAGGFRYYSRLRIDDPRQRRHETLAWSWGLDRYTRVSGEIPAIRF